MTEKRGNVSGTQRDTLPPLAIVGIGSLFPKTASSGEFWRLIKNGIDAITAVPETHWRPEDYYSDDKTKPDFTYAQRGGFLEPYDFDPMKYGVPPNAIEATDTSQLLGMVVAEEAMRDAGYGVDREFDRDKVSVILGVTGALELVIPLGARLGHPMWREAMLEAGLTPEQADDIVKRIGDRYVPWQENSFPGLLGNVVAGRISKYLNTGGTNCVVDAACASSLSALELAALELATGKSDMVLTGGADTFNDIFMYMCFSKTPALSPTGNARPFADGADGTILGEGLGMVVLKRLADAERDGDRVYAVIRGIGSSSDGKGEAIYAPSAPGQVKALRDAYANAGIEPETVELLEAHGTGTARGDAVETGALCEVYGELGGQAPWCALGSIKSQIGHTKAAAGAAGLIKVALALHNKVLPPTIKIEQPARSVAPDQSPFYVNTTKRPWLPQPGHPRRAAVSSFGFGGSNFHLVLEEYRPEKTVADWDGAVQLFTFSGQDAGDIETKLSDLPADGTWTDVRDAAARSRNEFNSDAPRRIVFVVERDATDLGALVSKAKQQLAAKGGEAWSLPEGAYYGAGRPDGKLAFVFPGQGAQYVGMLRDLACQFPQMLNVLAAFDAAYGANNRGERLSDFVYPHPAFETEAQQRQEARLRATEVAQPALGAVSYGAFEVLRHLGLTADAFAGHSYGELVALACGGAYGVEALAEASKVRGALMGQGDGDRGSMLAVRATADTLESVLREAGLDLVLANRNAPEQVVLSGDTQSVDRAAEAFRVRKISATKLHVAAAFHSPLVAEAAEPFAEALTKIDIHAPATPVYANTTAARYPDDPAAIREQLAHQLARPVAFVDEIAKMYEDGVRTFVEIGPGARMTGLIGKILNGKPHRAVALDTSNGKRDGIADLARLVAALAAEGREIDLARWDEGHVPAEKSKDKAKPRMVVPISGANYRSDKTKAQPRPPIMDKQPSSATTTPSHSKPAAARESADSPAVPNRSEPVASQQAAATSETTRERTPRQQVQSAGGSTDGPLGDLFRQTQASLTALQEMQEQTARLHAQYLQGQDTATRTFQQLIEQQQQLFAHLTGGHAPAPKAGAAPSAPADVPPAPARDRVPEPVTEKSPAPEHEVEVADTEPHPDLTPVLLEVVSEKTGYPEEMLELDMALDGDLGIDSIKRVEILSAMQERMPELPAIEAEELGSIQTLRDVVDKLQAMPIVAAPPPPSASTTPVAASTAPGVLQPMLLEVVAEKTGYPEEMLELDMALDADLGIDSIKRVEILSALQEKMPELPSLEAEELGTIHTLRDVLTKLEATPGAGAPAATAQPEQTGASLTPMLLEIVAEKTGYPTEMLELDMALDADLGIDSIKRVEILSALQERMPELPSLEAEELGALVTLRDVADALSRTAGPVTTSARPETAAPPSDAPATTTSAQPSTVTRQVLRLEPVPPADTRKALAFAENARIVVTGDDAALGQRVAERLSSRGFASAYTSLDDLSEPTESVTGLVVVASPDSTDDFSSQAFGAVQRFGPSLRETAQHGGALVATVSRLDGGFGLRDPRAIQNAPSGALAGLAKTAALEWPELTVRAFDLSPAFDEEDAAAALDAELLAEGPVETGLAPDATTTVTQCAEVVDSEGTSGFSADDVLVVTGGARGVTAYVAEALAQAGCPKLALLGRTGLEDSEPDWLSGLDEERAIKKALLNHAGDGLSPQALERQYRNVVGAREIRKTLAAIREAGAEVLYVPVDVRDAEAVRGATKTVRERFGAITGIVHGAGVLADRRIEDKTGEQFDAVYGTKVEGLRNVLDAVDGDALRTLVLFSSSTARYGRVGQADYAMANEVLNKIAQAEAARRRACRVLSVNWGPWDGGMVTPALRKLFETEGVGVISLEAGAQFLLDELAAASDDVEVIAVAMPQTATGTPPSNQAPEDTPKGLNPVLSFGVDAARHPFLESHVIDGKPVLPVAMYVEWMAHAALHANPGMRFQGIEDLRVLKGLILENGTPVTVELAVGKIQEHEGRQRVDVELRSVADDGRKTAHSDASVLLDTTFTEAEPSLNDVDLPAYKGFEDDIYSELLFHGPLFQGITHVAGCGDDGISVSAQAAPGPERWIAEPLRRRWLADPLALDCAFQALILWSYDRFGMASLPVRLGRYEQFQTAYPKAGVDIVARIEKASAHNATATVEFVNTKDRSLVARLEGYECVMDASLNEAFRRNRLTQPTVEH